MGTPVKHWWIDVPCGGGTHCVSVREDDDGTVLAWPMQHELEELEAELGVNVLAGTKPTLPCLLVMQTLARSLHGRTTREKVERAVRRAKRVAWRGGLSTR